MKKCVLFLLLCVFSLISYAQISTDTIILVPDQTKDQIYNSIEKWIGSTFVDSREVIHLRSRESMTFQGDCITFAKIKALFSFNIHIKNSFEILIKDGKYKYTTSNYMYQGWDTSTGDFVSKNGHLEKKPSNTTFSDKKWTTLQIDALKNTTDLVKSSHEYVLKNKQTDW